jgi:hypothetical protein
MPFLATMRAFGGRHFCSVIAGTLFLAGPICALPKPDEPVDPTKRAPISTSAAVKPAATRVKGDGVVNGRVIRMNEIPVRRSASTDKRVAVDVRETRKKDRVIKPSARAIAARKIDVQRAADRPAAIPRIDAQRFQRMLREYERDRVPAAEMVSGEVQVGGDTVDLGEINRFVNPRATLEAQGIPVIPAGSAPSAESTSEPVPVSQEKNGGDAPAAGR